MQQTPVKPASRKNSASTLSIILPCFNESEVLETTHARLIETFGGLENITLEIVYVDDGSSDSTGEILSRLAGEDSKITVVTLSRNFGHQAAVSAGLEHASGDAVAVMDADLQDPPAVILEMLDRWRDGYDVVYGIRQNRKEPFLLRGAYSAFYWLFRKLAQIDVPTQSGDFALMDRRVVDTIVALPERNRFVRGLRAWSGFNQVGLPYDRDARAAGETKCPFMKLCRLAFDGLFNFSTTPLTIIFVAGLLISFLSLVFALALVLLKIFEIKILGTSFGNIPGWTTLVFLFFFFGGIQLVGIGILGEYIGRIYQEVKLRPTFLVKDVHRSTEGPRQELSTESGDAPSKR